MLSFFARMKEKKREEQREIEEQKEREERYKKKEEQKEKEAEQKRLEEEQKRLEEEQKRLEEINKINKQLVKELGENFWVVHSIFNSIFLMYEIHKTYLEKVSCSIDDNALFDMFISIYRVTKEIESTVEFEKICTSEMISKLIKTYLEPHKNIKDFNKYLDYFNEYVKMMMNTDEFYIADNLYNSIDYCDYLRKNFNNLNDGDELQVSINFMSFKIKLMRGIFHCAKALNRILVISRNKHKLIANSELYKIQNNLVKQFNDYNIIGEKLCPIYEKFYKDTVGEFSNLEDLLVLIEIVNKDELMMLNIFEDNFISFRNSINCTVESIINSLEVEEVTIFSIVNSLERFIEDIDWNGFIINNEIEDDKNTFCYLYLLIIYKLKDNLPVKLLFYCYGSFSKIEEMYDKYKQQVELKEDRERFLRGDFSFEKSIERDKLEMTNIKTGIDFENYLKNIFEKLDYVVETTKASGDQGADLILLKDNIKTLVQAKYYLGSVGNKAVQEVASAIKFYNADKGLVVTNSYYTKSAIELAEANGIILVDGDGLSRIKESIFKKDDLNY